MTLSMTAFARQETHLDTGTLSWEIRSVNHRYLELSLRMEEAFRPLEIEIRKYFAQHIARGKVEAVLKFQPSSQQQAALQIDESLAQSVITACEHLATMTASTTAPIDPLRLLQWPEMVSRPQVDAEKLSQPILQGLASAVTDFIATRQREGNALSAMILQRCDEIEQIAQQVQTRMPEILQQHHQRLKTRIAELSVNLEAERLEQEIVLLAQKSDVAEELDRLNSHVVEVRHVLQRDEPIGRRLDFLMQELNREANTLSSKSIDSDTTRYAVDLKVLIEQMREQIQNIE